MQSAGHRRTKPFTRTNAKAGSYALGLLGLEERKLLYALARYSTPAKAL